jgi:6-phosphogluconate dehydrogenase
MIHNGIEYADMQLIAEAYDLLRHVSGHSPAALAEVFAEWNKGELESYLIEITAEVLRQVDAKTGKPFVDIIVDEAGSKGPACGPCRTRSTWACPSAESPRRSSPVPYPATASSGSRCARPSTLAPSSRRRPHLRGDVRKALYASKIIAYAQGFDAIIAGAKKYGWDIDKGAIATIWRGGCIIRAQFLNRIVDAYDNDSSIPTLLVDKYFMDAIADGEAAWRRVVSTAALSGIPVPGFAASLSYYDSLAAERLPAALVQAQRDFFGAHTYKRVDMPGTFHTLWSGDRSEIESEGSSH